MIAGEAQCAPRTILNVYTVAGLLFVAVANREVLMRRLLFWTVDRKPLRDADSRRM